MTLADYIDADLIELQVEAADWEAAVRAGGQLLLDQEICDARYIDAMVQAVRDMGPYMVLAPGISLAHARPEDGMLKVGMSIINLAAPVEFGNEANDPVYLVISFGGVDHESHVEMLRTLAMFLMEESNQDLLKTATSKQEILEAIQREQTGG
jgi:mannitol/fructose-specific phosphotransferase system IIA component (Ntr-type)